MVPLLCVGDVMKNSEKHRESIFLKNTHSLRSQSLRIKQGATSVLHFQYSCQVDTSILARIMRHRMFLIKRTFKISFEPFPTADQTSPSQ